MQLPRSKLHRTRNRMTEQDAQTFEWLCLGSHLTTKNCPIAKNQSKGSRSYLRSLALPIHLRPASGGRLLWRQYIPYQTPSRSRAIQETTSGWKEETKNGVGGE